MAKAQTNDSSIAKITPSAAALANRPAYLGAEVKGDELLKKYVTPSSVKIVQKQGSDDLIDKFGIGTALVRPEMRVLLTPDKDKARAPLLVTPVFFFPDWRTWSDIADKGTVPSVLDRSLDPQSSIAAKAQSTRLRKETGYKFGDKTLKVRHVEHLNFVCVLHEIDPDTSEPRPYEFVSFSFSKGEHKTGRRLGDLIKARKASMFDCVFEFRIGAPRTNQQGSWYGFDIDNPADATVSPWVTEAQHKIFEEKWKEAKELHESKLLRIADDEDDQVETPDEAGPVTDVRGRSTGSY